MKSSILTSAILGACAAGSALAADPSCTANPRSRRRGVDHIAQWQPGLWQTGSQLPR